MHFFITKNLKQLLRYLRINSIEKLCPTSLRSVYHVKMSHEMKCLASL